MQLDFPAIDPAAQIRDYRKTSVNISSLVKHSSNRPRTCPYCCPASRLL
jgi:hypothetical protein